MLASCASDDHLEVVQKPLVSLKATLEACVHLGELLVCIRDELLALSNVPDHVVLKLLHAHTRLLFHVLVELHEVVL